MEGLDLDAVKRMLTIAAERVIAARDVLTKADQAIGDGDHGVGMERGFTAARAAIAHKAAETVGDVFRNAGMAILGAGGGASGAVFGTLFIGAAKPLTSPSLDTVSFVAALSAGLAAVQARGKAKPGDKTMVDALAPAVEAAQQMSDEPLPAVVTAAAKAARAGSDATKSMIASAGKAKTLGERSLGHVDPGSITLALMLEGCADALK
jgi:dihydroxyacetone kinase-like protein